MIVDSRQKAPNKADAKSAQGRSDTLTLQDQSQVIVIYPKGDSILEITHTSNNEDDGSPVTNDTNAPRPTLYLVDTAHLRRSSIFFDRLLDPNGFAEGRSLADHHRSAADNDTLPRIKVSDLGPVGPLRNVSNLVSDLLRVLHSLPLMQKQPSLSQLVRLCIVVDRFEALPTLRRYRKQYGHVDLSFTRKTNKSALSQKQPEEQLRKRLLAHLLLQEDTATAHQLSSALIVEGLKASQFHHQPTLWWQIPSGIEEELHHRRAAVLDTIQSIQQYFMVLYAGRGGQQCRLGYNSSPECDSYQLGQMVRFFSRIGTLKFTGTLTTAVDYASDSVSCQNGYAGDINNLLDSMRQCSEYQIDAFHTHCGLRTRLLPILDQVQVALTDVGICLDCWTTDRRAYSWALAKRPLHWSLEKDQLRNGRNAPHETRHEATRNMFLARDRMWT